MREKIGFLYSFCKGCAIAKCQQGSKAKYDFILEVKEVPLDAFSIGAMI